MKNGQKKNGTSTTSTPNKETSINERFVSRRQFLYGVGATIALPPLLSLMSKATASGLVTEKKRRLCLLPTQFGMHLNHLVPDISAAAITHATHNNLPIPPIRMAALKDLGPNPLSYVIDQNMDDLRGDINTFAGLDLMSPYGHNFGFFCGSGMGYSPVYGRSIDAIIEDSAAFKASFKGVASAIRSKNNPWTGPFFFDRQKDFEGKFLRGEENAISLPMHLHDGAIFQELFGRSVNPSAAETADITRRTLLVDLVYPDYAKLKANRRISTNDKYLLDKYIEEMHNVQTKLQSPPLACGTPNFIESTNASGIYNWEQYWKNIFEMVILAFSCDQSRIYCGQYVPGDDKHHAADESEAEYWGSKHQKEWIHMMTRHLVRGLKSTVDPFGNGESLLDNTLVLWHNEHSGRAHGHHSIPVMTFGKLGGAVKSGYAFDYTQNTLNSMGYRHWGYPSKMMMVTLLEAMGVTKAEYFLEGDGPNTYGAWQKNLHNYSVKDIYDANFFEAHHNDPLPHFGT